MVSYLVGLFGFKIIPPFNLPCHLLLITVFVVLSFVMSTIFKEGSKMTEYEGNWSTLMNKNGKRRILGIWKLPIVGRFPNYLYNMMNL